MSQRSVVARPSSWRSSTPDSRVLPVSPVTVAPVSRGVRGLRSRNGGDGRPVTMATISTPAARRVAAAA